MRIAKLIFSGEWLLIDVCEDGKRTDDCKAIKIDAVDYRQLLSVKSEKERFKELEGIIKKMKEKEA